MGKNAAWLVWTEFSYRTTHSHYISTPLRAICKCVAHYIDFRLKQVAAVGGAFCSEIAGALQDSCAARASTRSTVAVLQRLPFHNMCTPVGIFIWHCTVNVISWCHIAIFTKQCSILTYTPLANHQRQVVEHNMHQHMTFNSLQAILTANRVWIFQSHFSPQLTSPFGPKQIL